MGRRRKSSDTSETTVEKPKAKRGRPKSRAVKIEKQEVSSAPSSPVRPKPAKRGRRSAGVKNKNSEPLKTGNTNSHFTISVEIEDVKPDEEILPGELEGFENVEPFTDRDTPMPKLDGLSLNEAENGSGFPSLLRRCLIAPPRPMLR